MKALVMINQIDGYGVVRFGSCTVNGSPGFWAESEIGAITFRTEGVELYQCLTMVARAHVEATESASDIVHEMGEILGRV